MFSSARNGEGRGVRPFLTFARQPIIELVMTSRDRVLNAIISKNCNISRKMTIKDGEEVQHKIKTSF